MLRFSHCGIYFPSPCFDQQNVVEVRTCDVQARVSEALATYTFSLLDLCNCHVTRAGARVLGDERPRGGGGPKQGHRTPADNSLMSKPSPVEIHLVWTWPEEPHR